MLNDAYHTFHKNHGSLFSIENKRKREPMKDQISLRPCDSRIPISVFKATLISKFILKVQANSMFMNLGSLKGGFIFFCVKFIFRIN